MKNEINENKALSQTCVSKSVTKPCPFCQNKYTSEYDVGGSCCFCDYEGVVSIGKNGSFSTIEQYNKIYFASNHQNRMDELHGRNSLIKRDFL
jgi:hypothetical protein